MCGLKMKGIMQFSSGLWPRKLVRLENIRSSFCSLPQKNMNSVESGRGRISSIYPTVLPEQKQGCTGTDSLPVITTISTDTDHMNDVGTFYSHRMPRRVRLILSKGSYNSHSFIHLLKYSLSIQLEAKQDAKSHRSYKIE